MQIFFNPAFDPTFNLALEEVLLRRLSGSAMMLWRNGPSVIIGRNQSTLAEVDTRALKEKKIPVIRRMTGGGAVYHDTGNLNYSCFADNDDGETFSSFAVFAQPIINALASLGVKSVFSGRNDILVEDKKISGTAKMFTHDRVLFHGTLLFKTDISVLNQVLTPDPEKVKFKGIRSFRSRVGNLCEYLPSLSADQFVEVMLSELLKQEGKNEPDTIPPEFIREAEDLAQKKYRTWEWNFGSAPSYDYCRKKRFSSGSVSVGLKITRGMIENASITGDFFGEFPVSEVEAALVGCELRTESLRKTLETVEMEKYILGVSLDDFLSLFE